MRQGGEPTAHLTEAQSDWFVREVQRCRKIGMPLGCCDEWPECSHILAWYEERKNRDADRLGLFG